LAGNIGRIGEIIITKLLSETLKVVDLQYIHPIQCREYRKSRAIHPAPLCAFMAGYSGEIYFTLEGTSLKLWVP
jgi:hypothetical protein